MRATLRASLDENIPILQDIAKGIIDVHLSEVCEHCGKLPSSQPLYEVLRAVRVGTTDRLRAIDMMAKYGFGPGMPMDEVRAKLKATRKMIEDNPNATVEELIDMLEDLWVG